MNVAQFRRKVREFRSEVDKSQEELAHALGLAPVTLSNKLNGSNNLKLNRLELIKIIKILAEWKGLTTQAQVMELLELMDCRVQDFSIEEWQSPPLSQLEVSPLVTNKLHATILKPASSTPGLPLMLTSFIGRRREIEKLKSLLSPANLTASPPLNPARLVSIVGPGGIGKTRLALEVAHQLIAEYGGEIKLVELASLSDPSLVAQALKRTFGLIQRTAQPDLSGVVKLIRSKPVCLILDNCEHLLAECKVIASYLLEKCPMLMLLVTSREGLACPGEVIFRLPPLRLPNVMVTGLSPAQLVAQSEAVQLFVERAKVANPSFSLSDQNIATLLRICQWLDGVPLAIELAAARTQLLNLAQIERRLADCFRLLAAAPGPDPDQVSLSGSARPPVMRHQTIRAVVEWSYNLLPETEKILWQRLSVFEGGWTLEAAESICSTAPIHSEDILDLTGKLVYKSIVTVESGSADQPAMRYRMLESIRQYGLEKLKLCSEENELLDRHQAYFLRLVAEVGPQIRQGEHQMVGLAQLESEHANLRRALATGARSEATTGQTEASLSMATGLGFFWLTRGYLTESGEWFRKLLERAQAAGLKDSLAFARACGIAGTHAQERGDYELALPLLEQSIAGLRDFGDKAALAQAYGGLGILNAWQGNYDASKQLFQMALELQKEVNELVGLAYSFNNLSNIAIFEGDYTLALAYQAESLALRRKLGDKIGITQSLYNLGSISAFTGDYAKACSYWLECLELQKETGDKLNIASTLSNLGVMANFRRDFHLAHRFHEEGLGMRRELGDKIGISVSLSNLGMLAILENELGKAEVLLHQSLTIRREIGNKAGIAKSLSDLGQVSLILKDFKTARSHLHESLVLRYQLGEKAGLAETLTLLAAVDVAQFSCDDRGCLQRAARQLGKGHNLLKISNRTLDLLARETSEQTYEEVEAALGHSEFKALFEEGCNMPLEDLLKDVLTDSQINMLFSS